MIRRMLLIAGCAVLALVAVGPAVALQEDAFSIEILIDGRPLAEYAARGRTYVEALEGREYAIRLRNSTANRVAVALSVDGLNTIDARSTASRDASKWILGPRQTIEIDGWQTGDETARRFYFTTEDRSYGAWLGQTQGLGLVSAVVYRERLPEPVPIQRPRKNRTGRFEGERPTPRSSGAETPSAPFEGADEMRSAPQREKAGDPPSAESKLDDDLAATGIGREVEHRVRRVRFEAESRPAARLELRYEYHDALVRLGVLPPSWARSEEPLERRERARGFRESGFAPDPFR